GKAKEGKKNIKSLIKSVDNLHSEVARLSTALNQATGLVWKFLASDEFNRVQGELLSLAASAGFERGLSMHQTKNEFATMLKKMAISCLISEHATEPLSVILQLEPKKLVRSANVPALRELSTNVNFTASTIAYEYNEEMVNSKVDGSDPKMTDDTAAIKFGHAFMQGISVALYDVVELVEVGSGRVSSGPNDVVVALSAHEKGDGLDPSSAVDEEAAANPFGV
ncbi:hypothetical protein Tco_0696934, partial [Tanacetum coccineum]